MRWGIIAVLAACHARLADPGNGPDAHPTPGDDAAPVVDGTSPGVDAAPLGPWGTPMLIPTGANPADDGTMSWAGGEFVYAQAVGGVKHLHAMTYGSAGFGTPAVLPFSTTMFDDESPRFSTDDLTLYFASNRGGASLDIYAVHRTTPAGAWGPPMLVAGPNTGGTDKWYAPCDADHYLVVSASAAGDTDIYEGIVGAAPAVVTALSSATNDTSAFLTRDCLTAYFASVRDGTTDLWMSQRSSVNAAWAAPTKVTDFGIADNEEDPWIAPDARTFTFAKATVAAPAQKQLYFSVR